jgi:hypothetical protein
MNSKQSVNTALLTFLVLSPFGIDFSSAQVKKLTAAEAKVQIGELATACGKVASTLYATTIRGEPVFLNLRKPYRVLRDTVVHYNLGRIRQLPL